MFCHVVKRSNIACQAKSQMFDQYCLIAWPGPKSYYQQLLDLHIRYVLPSVLKTSFTCDFIRGWQPHTSDGKFFLCGASLWNLQNTMSA